MRLFIAIVLLFCFITLPSLAGGSSEKKIILKVNPRADTSGIIDYIPLSGPDSQSADVIRTEYIKVVPAKEEPASGLAIGQYNGIATVTLPYPFNPTLGVLFSPAGNIGLVGVSQNLIALNQGYSRLHLGLLITIANQANSAGLFLGIEQYLARSVTVTFDTYPLIVGSNGITVGQAMIGAKFYL